MMTDEKAARLAAIRAKAAGVPAKITVETAPEPDYQNLPPAIAPQTLALMLLGAAAGAIAAVVALPAWLPGLSDSLTGSAPHAYWYLSRASAFVAFGLLWLSMALGLSMTNRLARLWPGGPVAFDLHQHASLLGLAFGLFHALILLGDRYMAYTPAQIVVPFASGTYRPLWVGLGQVGLYGLAIVGVSFYVKRQIGRRGWRAIHFLSFAVFALTLVHGITSGTDSGTDWASAIYWLSGASLLFLTVYRVFVSVWPASPSGRRAAERQS